VPESSAPVLLVEREDGLVLLTLNRPEAMNALSTTLRSAVAEAFGEIQRDPGVGAVILTGAGRAFCAGLDLKEMGGETRQHAEPSGSLAAEPSGSSGPAAMIEQGDMIAALRACPVPVIGAVNGFAITGGFELALACDFLIASSAARFADTHARVGIVPGWGISQLLPLWIGPGRARELAFTGNFLSAEQACEWGLVNRVVAPEELLPTCRGLARDILSCDARTVREIKRLHREGWATTLGEALRLEARASIEHARSVTAADVAARRRSVQERGRSQSR
jgi:enoyl-CoA hydratase